MTVLPRSMHGRVSYIPAVFFTHCFEGSRMICRTQLAQISVAEDVARSPMCGESQTLGNCVGSTTPGTGLLV